MNKKEMSTYLFDNWKPFRMVMQEALVVNMTKAQFILNLKKIIGSHKFVSLDGEGITDSQCLSMIIDLINAQSNLKENK